MAAAALVLAAMAGSPAQATGAPASIGTWSDRWTMQDRFARELVHKGQSDHGSYYPTIEHVHELQYRLRWAGVYRGPVTGHFGDLTRGAVKRFQKRVGLEPNGIANHATWKALIPRTLRARGLVPQRCQGAGWNLCYDRYRHQVTLWHSGTLWNSWLGRSGARGYETRTGSFHVYKRDIDHVSGLYGTPMPYSQFFSGGQAFHGSPFMVDPWVDHSHGCVNMYIEDARQLWRLTVGKPVDVNVYGAWS